MSLRLTLSLWLMIVVSAAIAQPNWTISKGTIVFKIKNAGITVDGSVGNLTGSVTFAPDSLSASSLKASVEVSTLETGIESRDEHLMDEDYFYVEKYPRITMESVKIEPRSATQFQGTFRLTIRDHTETVRFPFTFRKTGQGSAFDGEFEINRLDFGVGGKSFLLSNTVKVSLHVEVSSKL